MFTYHEDREDYYNYLLMHRQELRLSEVDPLTLKHVTSVRTYQNLAMAQIERSTISVNLALANALDEKEENGIQSIMRDSRLQTVRVNRFCYVSTYVSTRRDICIQETKDLINRLQVALKERNIAHEFSIEICWGGTEERMATSYFFPESIKCDWYTEICEYYPKSEDMFIRCLIAALIGAQANVYYHNHYDVNKVLHHLIRKSIITDTRIIEQKVHKNFNNTSYQEELFI